MEPFKRFTTRQPDAELWIIEMFGGDSVKSVVAAGRVAAPATMLKVPVVVAPSASVMVRTLPAVAQVVAAALCTVNLAPAFASVMPAPGAAAVVPSFSTSVLAAGNVTE